MTHSESAASLTYFLSTRDAILVVTFVGRMDQAAGTALERCRSEIENLKNLEFVVLFFRDVLEVHHTAIPLLAQIQKELRARPCVLSVCGLKPELKDRLLAKGVVRSRELSNNLLEALKTFTAAT